VLEVQTEILPDRQAKLVVNVEPERLQREMQEAGRRIAKKLNIPGFRRGKAPFNVIVRYVGEGALLEEALDPLGQAVYQEALDAAGVEPYAPGALIDFTRDPLTMTFTVPLQPEMELGNYRDLRVPFEAAEVTENDVDTALKQLHEDQATLEPVERPVQMGDVALMDIHGSLEHAEVHPDEPEAHDHEHLLIDRHDVRVLVTEDATFPVPGFPEKVIWMEAGQERTFDISMPDGADYDEEVRGKTLHFEVVCKEVYQRDVAELNDEFAQSVGDYDTLDALRAQLRTQLEDVSRQRAENQYLDNIFKQLEPAATVTYPPVMVDERIDELIEDFDRRLRERGLNVDEYLKLNNLTKERLRDDFREEAARSLKRALILTKLVELENLKVSDEEIDDEINTMLLSFGAQAAIAKQLFSSKEARRTISSRLISEMATKRLIDIGRGIAPELGTDEQQAAGAGGSEAKPAKRTRAKKVKSDEASSPSDSSEEKPKRTRKKEAQAEGSGTASEEPSR